MAGRSLLWHVAALQAWQAAPGSRQACQQALQGGHRLGKVWPGAQVRGQALLAQGLQSGLSVSSMSYDDLPLHAKLAKTIS